MGQAQTKRRGLQLPRSIALLNDAATAAGIDVRATRIDSPEMGSGLLVIEWTGDKSALHGAVDIPPSWHFPVRSGDLVIPHCDYARRRGHFLRGRISVDGEKFTFIARERAPCSIRQTGLVEVADYGDEIVYFGPKDALIEQGICTDKQFPGRHIVKEFRQYITDETKPLRQWATRRHQCGGYAYSIESEARSLERFAERLEEYCLIQSQLKAMRGPYGHCPPPPDGRSNAARAIRKPSTQAIDAARNDSAFQSELAKMIAKAGKKSK